MLQTINAANLSLTVSQWIALGPYLIIAVGAMLLMLLSTVKLPGFGTSRAGVAFFASVVVLAAGVWSAMYWTKDRIDVFNGVLTLDYFSSFFNIIVLASSLLVLFGSSSYLEKDGIHFSEFYPVLLIASLAMMLLAAAGELLTIFMALELMSICVYVLVGVRRLDAKSNEASIKYFIMGGMAGAILLYGVALIYGAAGSTKLGVIGNALVGGQLAASNPLFLIGVGLLLVGFMFKIAVAPFHMWTPDVYEGAPTIVTGYMATVLKAAVFASLIRIGVAFLGDNGSAKLGEVQGYLKHILWWLALGTMLVGNFVALMQSNFKRMLAYSAIAHTGYLLLGVIAGTKVGFSSVVLYLVVYIAMNLGAFGLLAVTSGHYDKSLDIENFAGLAERHPWIAAALTILLLSLAGIPPTAGFVGKYFLFTAALESGETLLALLAVIASVISVFYYMRVVVLMYMRDRDDGQAELVISGTPFAYLAIALCVAMTINFGLFPGGLLHTVARAALF